MKNCLLSTASVIGAGVSGSLGNKQNASAMRYYLRNMTNADRIFHFVVIVVVLGFAIENLNPVSVSSVSLLFFLLFSFLFSFFFSFSFFCHFIFSNIPPVPILSTPPPPPPALPFCCSPLSLPSPLIESYSANV